MGSIVRLTPVSTSPNLIRFQIHELAAGHTAIDANEHVADVGGGLI